jgi:hypothetical protein
VTAKNSWEKDELPHMLSYLFMREPDRRAAVWHYSYWVCQQSPNAAQELWEHMEDRRALVIDVLTFVIVFAATFTPVYFFPYTH